MQTHSEYSVFRGRGSLGNLIAELERQIASRLDFTISTKDLRFTSAVVERQEGRQVVKSRELRIVPHSMAAMDFIPVEGLPVLDQALRQIVQKAPIPGKNNRPSGIPTKFFRASFQKFPDETCDYLNAIVQKAPARRFIRVLDGKVRAFLSDSYRVIENYTVAKLALQSLKACGGKVLEASITDSSMRLKFVSPEIWDVIDRGRDDRTNPNWYSGGIGSQAYLSKVAARTMGDLPLQGGHDTVWPVITVVNSETGHSGFDLRGGILMGVCFNLATVEQIMHSVHLGQKLETGIYKADTIMAESEAIALKLRDNLSAFFNQEKFKELCARMRGTAEQKIDAAGPAVKKLIDISDSLGADDMASLVEFFTSQPGEKSVFNLGQAVSRYAQEAASPDAAEDLELFAGNIMKGEFSRSLASVIS